jgi:hypothetical protein
VPIIKFALASGTSACKSLDPDHFMGLIAAINHLLNFLAPALVLAALLVLWGALIARKTPQVLALWAQFAINFAILAATLVLALLLLGRDGRMAAYAALVLVGGTSQWLMLRGWR